MVVRLRLARFGRKKRPYYRIRAANARAPRDGKCLEEVRCVEKSKKRSRKYYRASLTYFFSHSSEPTIRSRQEWIICVKLG